MSDDPATLGVDMHPSLEVFEVIGTGASSTIRAGHDLKFDRPVAIKQLRPDAGPAASEAFKEEARFLSGLSHPNVVHVYDFDERRAWMVMELMRGSLDQEVEGGPLPAAKVREILRQALQGLEVLHAKNKLHGEIKPGNILVDDFGVVKLCDTAGVDMDGEFRPPDGSQRHVAPEVLNPQEFGSPGPGVDLYCLGLVGLELLTGPKFTSLFKGVRTTSDSDSLAWAQWHASPSENLPPVQRIVRGVPSDLAAVIDRLLKKHVGDRYASASQAIADLAKNAENVVERPTSESGPEVAEPVRARGSVHVTRPPVLRRRGGEDEKAAPREPLAGWSAKLKRLPLMQKPAAKRRALLVVGAAFGLILSALAASAPTPSPKLSICFATVDEDGEPVDATISIDGEPCGRAGEPIEVVPGKYEITATTRAGSPFESTTATFDLTKDSAPKIILKRRPPRTPPREDIVVVISPRTDAPVSNSLEATLWIDERKCPVGQREFGLSPGEHRLRVELEGHTPYEDAILVSPQQTTFTPTLKRLLRKVALLVEPSHAQVFLAGELLGEASPYQIAKQDGEYELFASCPEYESVAQVLSISGDGTYRITLPRSPNHSIRFETDPAGATVYVDGRALGSSPNRFSLPAGRHDVQLRKPGFAPIRSRIDVDATSDFFFWYLDAANDADIE